MMSFYKISVSYFHIVNTIMIRVKVLHANFCFLYAVQLKKLSNNSFIIRLLVFNKYRSFKNIIYAKLDHKSSHRDIEELRKQVIQNCKKTYYTAF